MDSQTTTPSPKCRKRKPVQPWKQKRERDIRDCARYRKSDRPNNWRIVGRYGHKEPEFVIVMGPSERAVMVLLRELFAEQTLDELNKIESVWIERWQMPTPWKDAGWMPVEEIPLQNYRLRAAAFKQGQMKRGVAFSSPPSPSPPNPRNMEPKVIPNAILNDEQWNLIEDLFLIPQRAGTIGKVSIPAREYIEAILWLMSKGLPWQRMPTYHRSVSSCRRKLIEWTDSGAFELAWDEVFVKIESLAGVDWRRWLSKKTRQGSAERYGTASHLAPGTSITLPTVHQPEL